MPVFAKILDTSSLECNILFVTTGYTTAAFNEQIHSYDVESGNKQNLIDLKLLYYKEPYES